MSNHILINNSMKKKIPWQVGDSSIKILKYMFLKFFYLYITKD